MIIKRILFLIVITILILVFQLTNRAYAESIFLKDGSIVEGDIINDTDLDVIILTKEKSKKKIMRDKIIRILFNNDYKNKCYIYKKDGTVIEAYIVDDGKESITIRKKIDSLEEFWIMKKDIGGITKKRMITPYYQPYSVPGTMFKSCIPIWSGSWTTGFNWIGFIFVFFKTTSLIGLTAEIIIFSNYSYSPKQGIAMLSTFGLHFISTIVDVLYSGIAIDRYNNKQLLGSYNNDRNSVVFSLLPRTYARKSKYQIKYNVDGLNAAVSYRF